MATKQEIIETIKKYYRHDRLEGRDDETWGFDYSQQIVSSRLEELEKYGSIFISCHESVTGERVIILPCGKVI